MPSTKAAGKGRRQMKASGRLKSAADENRRRANISRHKAKSAAGEYGRQASFFFSRRRSKTDRLANFGRHKSKVSGRRIRQAGELLLQPAAVKNRPAGELRPAQVESQRQANTAGRRTSSSAGGGQKPTGWRTSAGIKRNRRQANTAGRRASSSAGGGQKPTGWRTSAGIRRKSAASERRLRAKNSQRQPKNDDGRLTLSKRQPLV